MSKLKSLERLENSFSKLPSVGKKSAERMAYALLEMSEEDLKEFASAIGELKTSIKICPICGNITENNVCDICNDTDRDHSTILVVSNTKDIDVFEKTGEYKGLFHVLGGTISISKGIGVEDLKIEQLLSRIQDGEVKEIIIATNPTIDGETTALYLAKVLEKYDIQVTRIAYGLPMGAHIDYADSLTLARALEGRIKI